MQYKIKQLSKIAKLNVLKEAKKLLLNGKVNSLCYAIEDAEIALEYREKGTYDYSEQNMSRYGFKKPKSADSCFWWPRNADGLKIRIKQIEKAIKKLSK